MTTLPLLVDLYCIMSVALFWLHRQFSAVPLWLPPISLLDLPSELSLAPVVQRCKRKASKEDGALLMCKRVGCGW